jgi:hypothetical protein
VTFRSRGKDELAVGERKIEARRYSFRSRDNRLNGLLWLDGKGRMVQMEYPASGLRVILATRG